MRGLLATAAGATVALGLALGLGPHDRGLAFVAYLDFVCALLLVGLARSVCRALPQQARRRRAHAPQVTAVQVEQSDWLERQLRLAPTSADELHRQFRPIVIQIAAPPPLRKPRRVLRPEPARAPPLVRERL